MADRLKPEILEHLRKKLGYEPASIQVQLSILKRKYSGLTLNAAAQLYAQKHGTSILPKLTQEDKESLAKVQLTLIPKREVMVPKNKKGQKAFIVFLNYQTKDRFENKHVEEINGTYNAHCYTATFILCRKLMESLIIEILKKKFPTGTDRALYEHPTQRRFLDFSVVLDNIYKQRTKFSVTGGGVIQRLKQKATHFKNDANDKTHSLFHIATKTEIDGAEVQEIFDLIVKLNQEVGI